ncbi:MAG: nicotinate mononucleotide-dependent phosphoribosyltransferase CobT [Thermoprotei archaeon]
MSIMYAYMPEKGEQFTKRIEKSNLLAVYVIGSTLTSKIPGLSIAGANPEATLYTPTGDIEYLFYGKVISFNVIPTTPDGIPTPAIITRTVLQLLNIPFFVVNAGCYVKPKVPFIDVGGVVGNDIRTGNAMKYDDAITIYENAKLFGKELGLLADTVLIGESIPGGTTTTLTFLLALGYDARYKISSADANNPHDLKIRIAEESLKNANLSIKQAKENPLLAASKVGDPVMIAMAGLTEGIVKINSHVLLAGGTQMSSVLALLKHKNINLDKVAIGTTKWIIEDRSSDIIGLVSQIEKIPIIATTLNFSKSKFYGLKAYENGYVKEGVGAGGTALIAQIKMKLNPDELALKIEDEYKRLTTKINELI